MKDCISYRMHPDSHYTRGFTVYINYSILLYCNHLCRAMKHENSYIISGSKEVKRTKNSQIDIDRSIHFGHPRHIMLLLFSLIFEFTCKFLS